jgi:hypothetical protein
MRQDKFALLHIYVHLEFRVNCFAHEYMNKCCMKRNSENRSKVCVNEQLFISYSVSFDWHVTIYLVFFRVFLHTLIDFNHILSIRSYLTAPSAAAFINFCLRPQISQNLFTRIEHYTKRIHCASERLVCES